ncbi:MAG: hypothetical protein JNJ54_02040 [Myxococcaceae bacterium]|nr:hypothetical protein [Myxococcaceae bacterium]
MNRLPALLDEIWRYASFGPPHGWVIRSRKKKSARVTGTPGRPRCTVEVMSCLSPDTSK